MKVEREEQKIQTVRDTDVGVPFMLADQSKEAFGVYVYFRTMLPTPIDDKLIAAHELIIDLSTGCALEILGSTPVTHINAKIVCNN
jgi:hypothetical protein